MYSLVITGVDCLQTELPCHEWDVNPTYSLTHKSSSALTLSVQAVPNCCCSKCSAPYWSNPPFLIFDIRALWRSVLSARAPECQKIKNDGLDQYGKVKGESVRMMG